MAMLLHFIFQIILSESSLRNPKPRTPCSSPQIVTFAYLGRRSRKRVLWNPTTRPCYPEIIHLWYPEASQMSPYKSEGASVLQITPLPSYYPLHSYYPLPSMIPISRKPSFPPPPPPPPPYHHKRRFKLTPEDLQVLGLTDPPTIITQPFPTRYAPAFTERPSAPLPRTPSPSLSSVVDVDIAEQPAFPRSRPRSLSQGHHFVPESRGHPPPSPPPSASPSASGSGSTSTSAYLSIPRSASRATDVTTSAFPSSRPASHTDDYYVRAHEAPPILPSPTSPASPASQTSPPRSRFRSLAVLGLSKAARQATTQITEAAARQAAEEKRQLLAGERERRAVQEREKEETARQVLAQDNAIEHVRSCVMALLQGRLPPGEDRSSILSSCAQTCESQGLDLSTILQEMSIEGYPPIYWAIVNRSIASESSGVSSDSLLATLLAACRPLSPATLAAIRVGCTMASDNVLLQELFRSIPPLSHISTRDALLLGPAKEEDRVDVEEKRNGTGSWVALIKIPRFRLRMRVCQSVSVEFIASGRMWILTFSAVVETSPDGRTENRWYLSLELEEHSPPTAVNASLVILGSPGPETAEDGDSDDPVRSIHVSPPMFSLSPGHDKAIKIRLDNGPMGPYLLNESSLLVDSNKTLHLRLTQSTVPALVTDTSSDCSSHSLELHSPSSPNSDITFNTVKYHLPRPSNPPPPASPRSSTGSPPTGRKKKKRQDKVYVTLRRGGR